MKLRKFLITASIVALGATSAQALVVNTPTGDATKVLASELNLAATPVNGTFGFRIQRTGLGDYPQGSTIKVRVTLPAGRTINGDMTGNAITANLGSTGVVTAGGTNGAQFIEWDIVFAAGENILTVAGLAVAANADIAAGANMTVSVTQGGNEIDINPLTDATIFPPAAASNFADVAVVADVTLTEILLPNLDVFTAADKNIGTVLAQLVGAPSAIDYTPTAFAIANVGSASFTVNFPNGTAGITSATLTQGGGAGTLTGTITPTGINFATTGAPAVAWFLDGTPDVISVAGTPGSGFQIAAQTPTVTGVTYTLTPTPQLDASASATTGAGNTALETLNRQGTDGGSYDWVGENNSITYLRSTGFTAGATVPYIVTFSNAFGGAGFNGAKTGVATANSAGEITLNSGNAFGTSNAGYLRADVAFNWNATVPALDTDRLLLRSNNLASFGNQNGAGVED